MNGQSGQALPLAIMALAIGSLVVAPFLGYAGTGLIGSRVYGEAIKQQSAADAGVEHAIWRLVNGDLAGQLSQPGDEATYQLDETINGLTVDITVTANTTGDGPGGDISEGIIDTLEFDTSTGNEPSLINVSGDVYAIAYRGPGSDGFLKTVSVDADGHIDNPAIDTLEFDGSNGYEPCLTHVTGTVYAIAYRGPGSDGFLKTVSIAADGHIGNSAIDTLEFDGSEGYEPSIVNVSGNIYAIAYRGHDNDGFLKTVSIAADGHIGNSAIDTLEYDAYNGHEPSIVKVADSIYAIAYRGAGNDGFLKTVYIDAGGHIGNSVIDTLEFDGSNGYEPCLINAAGDNYAIAYRGAGNDGFLKTVSINSDGHIGNSVIDTLEFDTSSGYEPNIINVSGDLFAIAYRGPDDDGFLKTISIIADGDINAGADTLQYDTSSYDPVIIDVTDDIYAIAYRGPGSDGFIKTAGITATGGTATYEITTAAGGTTIHVFVSIDSGAAAIISWQIE